MWDFLMWILVGAVAGWIASIIMGTNGQQGLILNIIVGVIGAAIGGWLVGLLGWGPVDGFNFWSIIVAVLGAIVLLAIVRLFTNRA
jgi:uncharacterized membrane protein YeaQ/YmgE (transglycosylase-associated protein family)